MQPADDVPMPMQASVQIKPSAAKDSPIMLRIKPAVAIPEDLPKANFDFFLPITPKINPTKAQGSAIKLIAGIKPNTTPTMPRTNADIENPFPVLGFACGC